MKEIRIGKLQITIQTIKPDKIPITSLLPKRKPKIEYKWEKYRELFEKIIK